MKPCEINQGINRKLPFRKHYKDTFDFGMNTSYQNQLFNSIVSMQVDSEFSSLFLVKLFSNFEMGIRFVQHTISCQNCIALQVKRGVRLCHICDR